MDIVIDTSALLAVILDEPERDRIVQLTAGNTLIGPGAIPWEVGNAFSAMLKQKRLTIDEVHAGFAIYESIPVQFVEPDFSHALSLADQTGMYAYDAYFLDCAIRHNAPLLTLDRVLKTAANKLDVAAWEI